MLPAVHFKAGGQQVGSQHADEIEEDQAGHAGYPAQVAYGLRQRQDASTNLKCGQRRTVAVVVPTLKRAVSGSRADEG